MPRRATRQQKPAEMPETLIPPSEAAEKDKAAYWIGLLANPDDLKAATETTDFFVLLQEFPGSVWDRLAIYLYRLPDDNGMLIKNSDEKPHYIKVLHQPLTEEFVAKNWGGGKYQAYLKLDNKEVLRKHTFRIDGIPKMQAGQQIEIEGKTVPIAGVTQAPAAEPRTDIAEVITASADANRQNMEILAEGSKAAIALVRDQATQAAKPEAANPLMDKLMTALVDRIVNPPEQKDSMESALVIIDKLDSMAVRRNPAPEVEKARPLDETLATIKDLTGADSIADLLKPAVKAAASDGYGWVAPVVQVAQQLVAQIPAIMAEARINRALEFQRLVWLRTSQPGQAPPKELLDTNAAAHAPQPQPANAPATPQPQPPAVADPGQLANVLVQMICHGFDKNPRMGYQTAATIDFSYSDQIEALGLDKFLGNEQQVKEFVAGHPLLAQRAKDARWPIFQEDFLSYTVERWGEEEDEPTPDPEKKAPTAATNCT